MLVKCEDDRRDEIALAGVALDWKPYANGLTTEHHRDGLINKNLLH